MFVHHHLDAEIFLHRDRLLADAEEFRLARVARAARRRRRRAAATAPGPPAQAPPPAAPEPAVPEPAEPPVRPARNDEANRRSPVRA